MEPIEVVKKTIIHQLKSIFVDINEQSILNAVPQAVSEVEKNYSVTKDERFFREGEPIFLPNISLLWMNFLYRLSRILYKTGNINDADQVYYCNKILHSIDWFYGVELPEFFFAEHPLGSVLGRAKYGNFFMVYQGTTVGGNINRDGEVIYPQIGEYVIMFANSTIVGGASIGNNVIVSADTYIKDENIPDNCIVFGKSPNLVVKKLKKIEMEQRIRDIMLI